MSLIQPWMREYSYLNDYFWTLYQYYNESFSAYPVNYFSVDYENTIWEDTKLRAGAYDKAGVGDWSGMFWKKIFTLPVFGLQQVQPNVSSSERGLAYHDSLSTELAFPDSYKFKPQEGDIVDLTFGFSTESIKITPLYVVTSVYMAHTGVYNQMWQCKLKIAPFNLTELEKQISDYYMFMNTTHKILPIDKADLLLKLEERVGTISGTLNTLFNDASGFYLKEV